jgi:hypothetical protein
MLQILEMILENLDVDSILSIRLTNKEMQRRIDENCSRIVRRKLSDRSILVSNGSRCNIRTFLSEMSRDGVSVLPLTNFYITFHEDRDVEFASNEMMDFAKIFAPKVEKLTIGHFWCCSSDAEFNFYKHFKSMTHFTAVCVHDEENMKLPSHLIAQLKLIDFGEEHYRTDPFVFQLLSTCKELENLHIPMFQRYLYFTYCCY